MVLYFLHLLGFLAVIGLTGFAVLQFLKKKFVFTFFESLLLCLFSGYVLTITIFSMYRTVFKTVNILYVLLLLFAWWEVCKKPLRIQIVKPNINPFHVFILFVSLAVFFCMCFYYVYNPSSYVSFYCIPDYIYYAKIAKCLTVSGQENGFVNLNALDAYYNGPEPYHFFDLWGASFVHFLFGVNQYFALFFVIYPTFYFLTLLAAICIFKKVTISKIVIAYFCLWFGGFYFDFFHSIPFLSNLNTIRSSLFDPGAYKLSFFYLFIICSYLLFKNKLYALSAICLLGLATGNIVPAPTIIVSLLLISCLYYVSKVYSIKQATTVCVYTLLFAFALVLFYVFLKTERVGLAGAEIGSPSTFFHDFLSVESLTTQRNIIIGCFIYLIVLYFPILLIWLNVSKLKLAIVHPLFLFVFISVTVSITGYAFLYQEHNSSQLFYNLSIPLINVSAVILILTKIEEGNNLNWRSSAIGLLIVFIIVLNIYNSSNQNLIHKRVANSNEYLKMLNEKIPDGALVASIKSSENMISIHAKSNVVYLVGDYLFLFDRNIQAVNISDFDTPIDTSSKMNYAISMKSIQKGLYYRYAHFNENKELTKDELLLKFLKQYHIRFLVASKNSIIPPVLTEHIKSVVQDAVSGEIFVELNDFTYEIK